MLVEWMCHVVPHDLALSDMGIKIPEIPFPIDTLRVVLMRDCLISPLCHIYTNYPLLSYSSCISLVTDPRRLERLGVSLDL